jgi:hypothetical protein
MLHRILEPLQDLQSERAGESLEILHSLFAHSKSPVRTCEILSHLVGSNVIAVGSERLINNHDAVLSSFPRVRVGL